VGRKVGGILLVAESFRQRVAEFPFEHGYTQPLGMVSVSVGVATYRGDGSDDATLIQQVDAALCRAKHNRRNRVEVAAVGEE